MENGRPMVSDVYISSDLLAKAINIEELSLSLCFLQSCTDMMFPGSVETSSLVSTEYVLVSVELLCASMKSGLE